MALAQLSPGLSISNIRDVCALTSSPRRTQITSSSSSLGGVSIVAPVRSAFVSGSPLFIKRSSSSCVSKSRRRAASTSIRSEQSTQSSNSLDIWIGRVAMIGFAVAISVEIATGKGLLENFGLTSPLPTVALAITGLVGVLTAVFIYQSASKK